ncbi:MAG: nucleoside-triphosphatase [Acidobacteriota bacterium]
MIIILSGPVHGGKTTLIQKSLSRWAAGGLGFGGFLSIGVPDAAGGVDYDFLNIKVGRRLPFLRRTAEGEGERTGPFLVIPRTLDAACSLILAADPAELLIVDEIGPREIAGKGLWPALREVLFRPGMKTLLVAREEILEDLAKLLGAPMPLIIDACDPNAQRFLDRTLLGPDKPRDSQG